MKFFALLIILTLQVSAAHAGETVLMGTVVSVDRDRSEITVRVPDENLGHRCAGGREVVVKISEGWIPWGVRPGRVARIRGVMTRDGTIFSATSVRPGCGLDRTGIRGRLNRSGHGYHHGMRSTGQGENGMGSGRYGGK